LATLKCVARGLRIGWGEGQRDLIKLQQSFSLVLPPPALGECQSLA